MTEQLGPGTTIGGRYRLERAIGEGGHGIVYAASDTNVGRAVAVKVLHGALSGVANIEARFEREAILARSLNHPNTVRLLDFGRDGEGRFFIAYELLEGQALDAAIRTGPLAPERVLHIGKQVLKALMEAHAAGAVHRDIKPSNIFLCTFSGEADFVKVLDFGIAKVAADDEDLTATGFAIGTPNYMAPERVLSNEISGATDIYALGLVLAEALTGEVVMKGAYGAEVAAAQVAPDPVPLPPAVLQSPLGPVIHRAVQKPLERRYATAQEMLDALEAVVIEGALPAVAVAAAGPSLGAAETAMVGTAVAAATHAPVTVTSAGQPVHPVESVGHASASQLVPPPLVAARAPVTPKSKGSSAFWVGLFALAAIVLILGGGALVFALGANADERGDDQGPTKPKKKEKKGRKDKTEEPKEQTAAPPTAAPVPTPAADPVPPPPPEEPTAPAPAPTPRAVPRPAPPQPATPRPSAPAPAPTPTPTPPTPPCGCDAADILCQVRCAQRGGI